MGPRVRVDMAWAEQGRERGLGYHKEIGGSSDLGTHLKKKSDIGIRERGRGGQELGGGKKTREFDLYSERTKICKVQVQHRGFGFMRTGGGD